MQSSKSNAGDGHFPLTFRIAVAVCGGVLLTALACAFTAPWIQLALLGILLSISIGLAWECLASIRHTSGDVNLLETPFFLSHDTQVFDCYRQISQSLLAVSQKPDPIYREVALEELNRLAAECAEVAAGTIVYDGTETWRIVYDKLLRSPGIHLYRSVAWVKNANYWQDEPGRQSMKVNFQLHDNGLLSIERIVILADDLWPEKELLPVEHIHRWIREQNDHGIWVKMVRQSDLAQEPELIADTGIYGSRAVGVQQLDEQCRTVRFILTFDFNKVAKAEERWNRLSVYATSYQDLLDRSDLGG
jgi:hypothetical protein